MTQPAEVRRVIGIDLGTTNCALAYTNGENVEQFAIPQYVHPGETREEPLLPSFLYLEDGGASIAGVLAQRKGLENAARLVASAKSWLSHAGADRTAAILPINAPEGFPRISSVEASARYLRHLRDAWNQKNPAEPFDEFQVLVTVPASFDAVALDLTRRAAAEAGYRNVILLEEPQAAFYAWIERNPNWRELVGPGDVILVIDIGGGTTDFTLIQVKERNGEVDLERIAVGDHLLLGGDNIDGALAHLVAEQLPRKLDAIQFHALWQNCRLAKEKLLDAGSPKNEESVTILGRGAGVVGGTLKAKLKRSDLEQILLDGFLPEASIADVPEGRTATLTEIGLPFAADAAITRHLAHFLNSRDAKPTHVLFNGGVLRAALIRERILQVLNGWLPCPVQALMSSDLMHAVASGAAYYGLARQGQGVRVRAGISRTYYIGIEASMPAVPGRKPPLKALTVVPYGIEEGTDYQIRDRSFALSLGGRAQFRFFQSPERRDPAGFLLDTIEPGMEELAPVEAVFPGNRGENVAVTLEVLITETGVLEMWFVSADGRRWKLEFNVRSKR